MRWVREAVWPADWQDSLLVAIPKESSVTEPARVRPIALSSCMAKLLTKFLTRWMYSIVAPTLLDCQRGFL